MDCDGMTSLWLHGSKTIAKDSNRDLALSRFGDSQPLPVDTWGHPFYVRVANTQPGLQATAFSADETVNREQRMTFIEQKKSPSFPARIGGGTIALSTAFEPVNIAAAGLRHSRAPFRSERACAESQAQQR
jgi:hypothetical protein